MRTDVPARALACFVLLGSIVCASEGIGDRARWAAPGLRFRCPVTVEAGIYPREGTVVRCVPDFTAMFRAAGEPRAGLDVNAIRVVADAATGHKETPHVFFEAEDFDSMKAARGELVWRLSGKLAPLDCRRYWLYFDTTGPVPRKAPVYPPIPGVRKGTDNAVRNPGFEELAPDDTSRAAHWSSFAYPKSRGTCRVVSLPRYRGKRAIRLTCAAGRCYGCRQTGIPMKPNALYRAGAWVRADPANRPGALVALLTVWLYRKDGRKVKTSNAKLQTSVALSPGRWARVDTRGLAYKGTDVLTPPDTTSGDLQISLHPTGRGRDAEAVGVLYVDDAEVVEVTPAKRTPPATVVFGKVERKRPGRVK